MAIAEVMNYVSQAGGLVAIGLLVRGLLAYVVETRGDRARTKIAQQTGDVDNLTKLLQLTPGEVVRLQESLSVSEARVRTMRSELNTAHTEIDSLRGQMAQMSIQLSNAMMTINELRQKGKETDGSR